MRRDLLRGLWRVLTLKWVTGTPSSIGETCAVEHRRGDYSIGEVTLDAYMALDRAVARKTGEHGVRTWNDQQTWRWPVVWLYVKALVRG